VKRSFFSGESGVSPDIQTAAVCLRAGGLVAFPTETVYGLGADAANAEAARKIFTAKGRPANHPLIVHLARAEDAMDWAADIPEVAFRLADAFWPGPLTLVLKKQTWIPEIITGGQDTIALRVPAHPMALSLLQAFAALPRRAAGAGIAAPSANRFGRVSPTAAAHVREELGGMVEMVLEDTTQAGCHVGIESTILDLTRLGTAGAVILRPGGLAASELAEVLGDLPRPPGGMSAPRVPGALPSHYAPGTPLRALDRAALGAALDAAGQTNRRCGALLCRDISGAPGLHVLRVLSAAPEVYARALYAALRELDRMEFAEILVEMPPDTAEWAAVRDRLFRAAAK
jgi:L-threonylcarbamoyladenylate synthase